MKSLKAVEVKIENNRIIAEIRGKHGNFASLYQRTSEKSLAENLVRVLRRAADLIERS